MKENTDQPILFAIGVNHKTASVEIRERVYIHEHEIPVFLEKLGETLAERLVVSTCNRTEIYGVTHSSEIDLDFYKDLVINFKNAGGEVERDHFFSFISCSACQQLFKVSTSIDSKIIGDTQILQQMRKAYTLAKENRSTGKILNQLAQRAFKLGKKTYNETSIHKGAVSVSLAAVELAAETFGSIKDKAVLIVGAGDTARMTAECLIKKEVGKIFIVNRTRANAEELLSSLQKSNNFAGEVIEFSDFKKYLNHSNIVISSTSSNDYILDEKDFENQTNKILLIDIAVPRDISPSVSRCRNVILRNIDDLHGIVGKNFEKRMSDLPMVKRLIMQEMSEFLVWYYSLPLLPEFQKRNGRPEREALEKIKQVKDFLAKNASLFQKIAEQTGSDAASELKIHLELVEKLYAAKGEFGKGAAN